MNPDELAAQQQALLNQAMQAQQQAMHTQQGWVWGMIAVQIALLIIGGWVIYMFYARLRDVAEELMKLRVAYEFANPPKSGGTRPLTPAESAANPFIPSTGNDRYKPKS
ncbi:MAG: hypothetical protein PHY43_02765 [Verrucomicrobiales bacterium]|nr:hypothetical protein [Verrucomicrobiales bacterium]